jgi:hypothetical protein
LRLDFQERLERRFVPIPSRSGGRGGYDSDAFLAGDGMSSRIHGNVRRLLEKTSPWPAQGIEALAPRPVDEEGEFIAGRVARDRAAAEGVIARVVERGEARDGYQLGAGDDRAHGQTLRMRVMPPFEAVTPGIDTDASSKYRQQCKRVASTRYHGNMELRFKDDGTHQWIVERNWDT